METLSSLGLSGYLLLHWKILVVALALAVFAFLRIWRSRCAVLPLKIFWTVIVAIAPIVGALFALAFVRIRPRHGEAIPPTRGPAGTMLSGWQSGWR